MPRAATSVATKACTRPLAKSASARVRWLCLRPPWIAAAWMPALPSCLASRSDLCRVRQKTMARPHCAYGLCGDPRAVDRGYVPEHVMGRGDVRGLRSDLVTDGILLVVAGELGHVAVEGRGEQHGLALAYRLVEQPANGGHEAHVGHSVGLVEHDPGRLPRGSRRLGR